MTIVALNAVGSPAQLAWALSWRYWVHSLWMWVPVNMALGLLLVSWAMGNVRYPDTDPTPIYVACAILHFAANLGVGLLATIFAIRAMNGKAFGKSNFYLANQTDGQVRLAKNPKNLIGVAWNISWRFILPVDALWALSILAVLNYNFSESTFFYGFASVFYVFDFVRPAATSKVDFSVFVGLVMLTACVQFLTLVWVLKSQHLKNIGGSTFMTATMQNDEASADAD